jgi:hypothetical protein
VAKRSKSVWLRLSRRLSGARASAPALCIALLALAAAIGTTFVPAAFFGCSDAVGTSAATRPLAHATGNGYRPFVTEALLLRRCRSTLR